MHSTFENQAINALKKEMANAYANHSATDLYTMQDMVFLTRATQKSIRIEGIVSKMCELHLWNSVHF